MTDELARLRRDVRLLKAYALALTAAALVGGLAAFGRAAPADQVLRARGLVIVDAAGRERILIGAPVPAARHRLRTDTARVRRELAPQFGGVPADTYMGYYRDYRYAVHGILVLDERGVDRVALGDSVPDPNIGRRIGPSAGLMLNDARGFERSGYGVLTVGGRDRVVLGLDAKDGEAVVLSVHDSGTAGLRVSAGGRSLYVGAAPAGQVPGAAPGAPFFGILASKGRAVTYQLNTAADTARARRPAP